MNRYSSARATVSALAALLALAGPAAAAGDSGQGADSATTAAPPALLVLDRCSVIAGCTSRITISGDRALVSAQLLKSGSVGILVQRIVRERRVRGRLVRKLRLVGRVPFGPQRAGRIGVRWNLKVRRRHLAPGRFLVTLRAFDAPGTHVIDRARPVVLTIRR